MIRVYICHPFSGDTYTNQREVREYCRAVTESSRDHLPIAPQIYLPQWMDDATDRDHAMDLCLRLLDVCDELWICGDRVSAGMRVEIDYAGMPKKHRIQCFKTPDDVREYLKDIAADPPF